MTSLGESIEEQYEIIQVIGKGSFSQIKSLRSRRTKIKYACKIQIKVKHNHSFLQKEFNILSHLGQQEGFPKVYSIKPREEGTYVILECLDQDLKQLSKKYQFDLNTVALVSYRMFKNLYVLHSNGYLHRDIKPDNIMTSLDSHDLKLIDFGLSDKLEVRRGFGLIGSVRFASRGAHLGYSSRKDDLQGLIFMLHHLLQRLPWEGCSQKEVQQEIKRRVLEGQGFKMTIILAMKDNFLKDYKIPASSNLFTKEFYTELNKLTLYVYNLAARDNPDYKLILHKCERLMAITGVDKRSCYCWCPPNCPFNKQLELDDIFKSDHLQ